MGDGPAQQTRLRTARGIYAGRPSLRGKERRGVHTRGAAVHAADACGDVGLQVAALGADSQRALRDLLGHEALVAGPVDTTVLVTPSRFRRSLELVGVDPGVDAVLALTIPTAGSDLVPEVGAARLPAPIAVAVMDQVEVVRLLRGPGGDFPPVPAYAYAESAVPRPGQAALRHLAVDPAGPGAGPGGPAPGPGQGAGRRRSRQPAPGRLAGAGPTVSCSAAPDAACKRRCLIITSHLHPSGLDTIMPKTLATVTACWTTPTSSSPRAPASASPKPSQEKQ